MPQSLSQIYLHLVFSTKNRLPFLKTPGLRAEMHAYLAGVCRNQNCLSLIVGGVEDHVHILCTLGRQMTVANLVRELKRDSSKWMKTQGREYSDFQWQNGYGAFSVSPSHVPALQRYIRDQVEHHRQETFQDEFRRLLKKYGVAYDERYVWD
jgi:REP element-mobilizing transposase RayT